MSAAPEQRPGQHPQRRPGRRADRRPAPVNLARRPFANRRPIKRLAVLLWVLGVAVAILAAALYWRSFFGIEGKREELATVQQAISRERTALDAAEQALQGMRLAEQNEEVIFLNSRIAARAFPWSALFEDLGEVLPRGVRLFSLSPQEGQRRRTSGSRRPPTPLTAMEPASGPRRVLLQMTGAAEDDEALLALLDRLFASSRFSAPSLPRETREGGMLRFVLEVYYLPTQAPRAVTSSDVTSAVASETTVEAVADAGGEAGR